jgi:hypothetical protein
MVAAIFGTRVEPAPSQTYPRTATAREIERERMNITINQTKLRSTFGFLCAFLVAYGPDVVTWIGGMEAAPKWLREAAKGLGVLIGVLTSRRGVLLLNRIIPPPVPATSGAAQPSAVLDITQDIRPPDKGHATPTMLMLLAFATLALCAGAAIAFAGETSPPAGGCFSSSLCVGPSASLTVAAFNLTTSQFSGGVSPGIGYGLTYTPPTAAWAAVGLDIYASLRLGQGTPNQANLAIMLHGMNVYVGFGPAIIQGPPTVVQWSLFAGPGVSVQSASTAYEAAAKGTP